MVIPLVPAEDSYLKSELIKNSNLIADDIITNLNLNFQQKRTKTAITQRIKKINSDLKSHIITVQVPSAASTTVPPPLPPQNTITTSPNDFPDGALSEEEEEEEIISSDDEVASKVSKPTAHIHTPLEFFGTEILPLEDDSFKLIFGYPPFDIEIKEVQYLNDGKIGIRYFILLPSRDDLEPIVGADYASRWYIKYDCLPLKTSIFSFLHHSSTQTEKEKYLGCEISIEKSLKFFQLTISPKKKREN
ncbi:hypothetical protein ACTFIY_002617 [Dictyostelium cf. discoideum]